MRYTVASVDPPDREVGAVRDTVLGILGGAVGFGLIVVIIIVICCM
jgi:hypothetical protein